MPWVKASQATAIVSNPSCAETVRLLKLYDNDIKGCKFYVNVASDAPENVPRECHGLPWGFPGQPAPAPVKTRTRVHGYGFDGYGCRVFTNPWENSIKMIIIYKIYYL